MKPDLKAGPSHYSHLLNAPRTALDAMVRGEVLAMSGMSAVLADSRLSDAEVRNLVKRICVANDKRLGIAQQ